MTDPTRLLSGEASDFERELLGAWDAEQPGDDARAKVLAMAGLAAGAAVATGAASAVGGKAGVALGGSIAPAAGAAGGAALAKWLLLGAIGIGVAGGSVAYLRRAHREETRAPTAMKVAPIVTSSPRVDTPPPAAPLAAAPTPTPRELTPSRPAPSGRHAATTASADRSARAKDDALGEQVSALDAARRTLASGDAAGALRELDDYTSRFPRGALTEEAEALRVESLLATGDHAGATQAGARFLGAHPASPLAPRVRALLGQGSDR